jgi:phospholipase C
VDPNTPYIAPFHIDYAKTGEVVRFTCHLVESGIGAWNKGHYNRWIEAKLDTLVMGYLKHKDVSYHRHLANSFTICDQYFSSVHGDTNPNRLHLFSGTASDPSEPYRHFAYQKGFGSGPNGPEFGPGCRWKTYPERIEEYNRKPENKTKPISWRVYQGGTGQPGSPTDNFGDNSLEYFSAYRNDPVKDCVWKEGKCLVPDGWLRLPKEKTNVNHAKLGSLTRNGVTNRTLKEFAADIKEGKLPNVTWIVPPEHYSEHTSKNASTDGAYYINKVLSALVANPEVWSKTVFIINYDENDGFFDHVVPPMPPIAPADGKVSPSLKKSLRLEYRRDPLICYDHPIGFGPRVPCLVVSPWSKGGWVNSQVFDHTSVLRFLEARFGIQETNITDWRRAVAGDLTSAPDFANPDNETTGLVKQTAFKVRGPASNKLLPNVPNDNTKNLPKVENPLTLFDDKTSNPDGSRKARAIPYEFYVTAAVKSKGIDLTFSTENHGIHFNVYNNIYYWNKYITEKNYYSTRRYTVVKGSPITDSWAVATDEYDITAYGPNGYLARFKGRTARDYEPDIVASVLHLPNGNVRLTFSCLEVYAWPHDTIVKVSSKYLLFKSTTGTYTDSELLLMNYQPREIEIDTKDGWYDISVQLMGSDGKPQDFFLRRFAGHVETGKPSKTDPFLTKDLPVAKADVVSSVPQVNVQSVHPRGTDKMIFEEAGIQIIK